MQSYYRNVLSKVVRYDEFSNNEPEYYLECEQFDILFLLECRESFMTS